MNQTDIKLAVAPRGDASSSHGDQEDDHGHALSWQEINRVLFVAITAGAIWFFTARRIPI